MFIVTFILHVAFGWWQYAAEQAAHGAEATFWGPDGYIAPLGEWTFQNWQSEFMIVLFMILATTRLIHRGSHESKDGTEEMQRSINRIEKRVAAVVERRQGR
jgi:hypothetical protein